VRAVKFVAQALSEGSGGDAIGVGAYVERLAGHGRQGCLDRSVVVGCAITLRAPQHRRGLDASEVGDPAASPRRGLNLGAVVRRGTVGCGENVGSATPIVSRIETQSLHLRARSHIDHGDALECSIARRASRGRAIEAGGAQQGRSGEDRY